MGNAINERSPFEGLPGGVAATWAYVRLGVVDGGRIGEALA